MKCPDCNSQLQEKEYEGFLIDVCNECGGSWLDYGELSPIIDIRQKRFSEEERITTFQELGVDVSKGKLHNCPKCGKQMQKFNYAINTGIILDRCPDKDGLWFDKGELEKIQIVMEEHDNSIGRMGVVANKDVLLGVKECPRCHKELREINYEGVKVDICYTCGGKWCDNDELYQIIKLREKKFADLDFEEVTAKREDAKFSIASELVDCLPCPICNHLMERINYSYTSGVIIDRCRKNHGIWLDKDELEKLQVFVERGEGKEDEYLKEYISKFIKIKQEYEMREEKYIASIKVSRIPIFNKFMQCMARIGIFD
ncbi:MAG: zf-TFIIB domain-containing protein [bacterium]